MAAAGTDLVMPSITEPEVETRARPAAGDAAGDWLCCWCHNRVANERDRFRYDGRDEFAFSDPEHICFVILTFSETLGCRQSGVPTTQHTWFLGHAWSYCLCDDCGQHLGWYYSGPQQFVGLIKDRLVRRLTVSN